MPTSIQDDVTIPSTNSTTQPSGRLFSDDQLDKILKTLVQLKFPERMSFSVIDIGPKKANFLSGISRYTVSFATAYFLIDAKSPLWYMTLSMLPVDATIAAAACLAFAKMFSFSLSKL